MNRETGSSKMDAVQLPGSGGDKKVMMNSFFYK